MPAGVQWASPFLPEGRTATSEDGSASPRVVRWAAALLCALACGVFAERYFSSCGGRIYHPRSEALAATADSGPRWGCGLIGTIPGITADGQVSPSARKLIDGLKASSSLGKVSYWNWALQPNQSQQPLTSDFVFMPEQWGAQPVRTADLPPAGGPAGVRHGDDGSASPAEMATILLGMNEPDINGSCMGDMFGRCTGGCTPQEVAAHDCPAALPQPDPPAQPNAHGRCNCWQFSSATGVGFWPLAGCRGDHPLPSLWGDAACAELVVGMWKATAAIAHVKGYQYLSTPLVAMNMGYAKQFIEKACGCSSAGECACTDASCGCPQYVGFHFYAYDCRPEAPGGYAAFQQKLAAAKEMMEEYPFVKGAIINEVGMLNCAPQSVDPICVPNSGQHPANASPHHGCLPGAPTGLPDFLEKLLEMVAQAKTTDGRDVVKGFTWFNENGDGGTYNLQLFKEDGSLSDLGEAYIRGCQHWAEHSAQAQG